MYVLSIAGKGTLRAAEIAEMVSKRITALGGSDVAGMRHLVAIENLGMRGTRYANEDFDVLAAAHRWAVRS